MAKSNGRPHDGEGVRRSEREEDPPRAVLPIREVDGSPTTIRSRSQLLVGGMRRLEERSALGTKSRSHSVTAEIEVPEGEVGGVVVSQGGSSGGWSLYVQKNRLKYCYNLLGAQHSFTMAESPLPAGKHQVRMEFAYDGGGLGKGARITLFVDGKPVGSGRAERTHSFSFGLSETTEVGCNLGSPVSPDYPATRNGFTGGINWVQIDVGLTG